MAEIAPWERRFVEAYVQASWRDRYLTLLRTAKGRRKVLDRLNHSPCLDLLKARTLEAPTAEGLLTLLRALGVGPTAHLMADGSALDGQDIGLERAVEELIRTGWGTVLICPPQPVAIYRGESPGPFYLLSGAAT